MPFTAEQKKAVVEAYRQSETDTGSPEVHETLYLNMARPSLGGATPNRVGNGTSSTSQRCGPRATTT